MISAYTGTQIREAEKPLLQGGGGAVLMQRAAYGLANAVVRELAARGIRPYGASVAVLAGKGNNGGDGLFAGALLAARGMRTTAVLTAGEAHPEGLAAFERAGGRASALTDHNATGLAAAAASADVVIDAVLGTGAQGGLRGPSASLIGELRSSFRGFVVACDIPSGVNADTGEAYDPVLPADITVTFGGAKAGLLADPGADHAGRVLVIPIGIEGRLPSPVLRRLESADLARLLPPPARRSHKYSRGVLGIVAGSQQYPGAAVLACQGALAAGAGMVRYLGPPEATRLVRQACPEVVCGPDDVADAHVQAWLVGSGIPDGDDEQLRRVRDAMETGLPVAADAGALPALPDILAPHVVLTPHAGELAHVLQRYGIDLGRQGIEGTTLDAVRQAAERTGATVLLKGATTLVAAPSGPVFSQAEATPWMATAGSGDVLAGALGSLLAQHADDEQRFDACGISADQRWAAIGAMAASLHGRAGSLAARGGPVTAGAIASHLPEAVRAL